MKKSVKKLWTDALRSGQYKQGIGQLRNEQNEFCCLGVLCNLHAQAHPKIAKTQLDAEHYLGDDSFPPDEVIEWAGLHNNNPELLYKQEEFTLASLNDASGLSFKKIAKLIEAQL